MVGRRLYTGNVGQLCPTNREQTTKITKQDSKCTRKLHKKTFMRFLSSVLCLLWTFPVPLGKAPRMSCRPPMVHQSLTPALNSGGFHNSDKRARFSSDATKLARK